MQKMNPQDIKYGYIIVPKTLLTEQFTNCDTHEGEVEAFLKIIMKTNYSETQHTDYWNNVIVCQRGESLHSYRSWSVILHWSASRTYRFIQHLQTKGMIEIIPHKNTAALHIRIVNYDSWVNMPIPTAGRQLQKKKASNEKFRLFWTTTTTSCSSPKRTSPRRSVSGKS